MSYAIDIALYIDPSQLPDALAAVAQRLRARGEITKITMGKKAWSADAQHFATTLSSAEMVSLAQQAVDSRRELLVDIVYDLPFGGGRSITIQFSTVPIHSMVHGPLT